MTLVYNSNNDLFGKYSSTVEYHFSDDEEELNEEDENGNSPLIFAVVSGKDDIVRTLVDQVKSHKTNLFKRTAIYRLSSKSI